ncbi:hypothetical protein BP6252_01612 [Coleophoma cylindrospora]|uniref:Uncharacterized protein n=1 Tax=Coleophoma cylindrospora TaxID=1849047 RepID=A0A3D8STD6_9HELO|nr:hypothetical protein BP6252_01612 [Coleophoma cylindrospora]
MALVALPVFSNSPGATSPAAGAVARAPAEPRPVTETELSLTDQGAFEPRTTQMHELITQPWQHQKKHPPAEPLFSDADREGRQVGGAIGKGDMQKFATLLACGSASHLSSFVTGAETGMGLPYGA